MRTLRRGFSVFIAVPVVPVKKFPRPSGIFSAERFFRETFSRTTHDELIARSVSRLFEEKEAKTSPFSRYNLKILTGILGNAPPAAFEFLAGQNLSGEIFLGNFFNRNLFLRVRQNF